MYRNIGGAQSEESKEYNRLLARLKRTKKNKSEREYNYELFELYKHSPLINKQVNALKRKYPYLTNDCYEKERLALAGEKLHKQLYKESHGIRKTRIKKAPIKRKYSKAKKISFKRAIIPTDMSHRRAITGMHRLPTISKKEQKSFKRAIIPTDI
jgi:hypothetical protein